MSNHSLREFVSRISETTRITSDDVRLLQRDILPGGIGTRDEAEALIALEQSVTRAPAVWADYLVTAIVDFAVWRSRPTGYIDQDIARWLLGALSCGGPTRTGVRIAREVVREAQEVDDALLSFAMISPKRAPGPDLAVPMAAQLA